MITDLPELARQAAYLATRLVDQIEWVDVLDERLSRALGRPVREDGAFSAAATAHLTSPRRRDELKRIVDRQVKRILASPLAQRLLNPEEVLAAAELVTAAVKGLVAAGDAGNRWILRRRLVIQFTSIEAPWVEDALVGEVIHEAFDPARTLAVQRARTRRDGNTATIAAEAAAVPVAVPALGLGDGLGE